MTKYLSGMEGVVGGCDILKQGLKWEVGDGKSIRFLSDHWVTTTPIKF